MTMRIYADPCHLPCPDLPHHSLTKADKELGLEFVKKAKADLEKLRQQNETEREKRKRMFLAKIKEKSLRLPNRVVKRSLSDEAA